MSSRALARPRYASALPCPTSSSRPHLDEGGATSTSTHPTVCGSTSRPTGEPNRVCPARQPRSTERRRRLSAERVRPLVPRRARPTPGVAAPRRVDRHRCRAGPLQQRRGLSRRRLVEEQQPQRPPRSTRPIRPSALAPDQATRRGPLHADRDPTPHSRYGRDTRNVAGVTSGAHVRLELLHPHYGDASVRCPRRSRPAHRLAPVTRPAHSGGPSPAPVPGKETGDGSRPRACANDPRAAACSRPEHARPAAASRRCGIGALPRPASPPSSAVAGQVVAP